MLGTLVTLLITSSPFTQRGRELVQWGLKRIPRLSSRYHTETMAIMAFLALVLVALTHFVLMPPLANWYNLQGLEALQQGELTSARQYFQRAVAINNDFAAGCYHLANVYEEIARPDEAIRWYQQTLEHDLEFSPAYNNLGRLYLMQRKPNEALPILQAGLTRATNSVQPTRPKTNIAVTSRHIFSDMVWT